jgi:t-SNARE complex subunit (syntaxin)
MQRKRNRFLKARRDGSAYTMKPEVQSQHAAYRRSEKSMQARCENCEIALR